MTHDPEHLASMIHAHVDGLRARLRNEPGFNYLGRLKAAIANDHRLPATSVEANWLRADVRTLRELADELEACRDLLTGVRPLPVAAE